MGKVNKKKVKREVVKDNSNSAIQDINIDDRLYYVKSKYLIGLEGYDRENKEIVFKTGKREKVKDVILEFLDLYIESGGNTYLALAKLGLRRNWINIFKEFDGFEDALKEADETIIDFVEFSLFQKALSGNVNALKLYLQARGRDRGYGDKPNAKIDLSDAETKNAIEETLEKIREKISNVVKSKVIDIEEV